MVAPSTYTVRQPGLAFGDLIRLTFLASPIAVLVLLLWHPHLDPRLQAPAFHFMIVTMTTGLALVVGLLVLAVAGRLGDARALALGLAFSAIAGFLFIHGLLTPGFVFKEASNWIGWAPLVGLMLGAVFLLFSTVRQRPGGESWVFARRRLILACLVAAWTAFLILAITFPKFLYDHPTSVSGYLSHGKHELLGQPTSSARDEYSRSDRAATSAKQEKRLMHFLLEWSRVPKTTLRHTCPVNHANSRANAVPVGGTIGTESQPYERTRVAMISNK